MNNDVFDFSTYHKRRQLCLKPIDWGQKLENSDLGYFNHCTDKSDKSNDELENEFYRGDGRFYMYDIKLCHTTTLIQYKTFLKEFRRRTKKYPCVVHLSNSTVANKFNSMTSIYDIPYLKSLLLKILTTHSDIVIEISDKRLDETPDYDMYRINEICDILQNNEKVKHYMIREEIYSRIIHDDPAAPKGFIVQFMDNYTMLRREVIRYDELRNNQRD